MSVLKETIFDNFAQWCHLLLKCIVRADVVLHFPSNFPKQSASRDINFNQLDIIGFLSEY